MIEQSFRAPTMQEIFNSGNALLTVVTDELAKVERERDEARALNATLVRALEAALEWWEMGWDEWRLRYPTEEPAVGDVLRAALTAARVQVPNA